MTRLHKPVRREVVTARRESLVAVFAAEGLYLREPRRRMLFGPLDWGRLYLQAVRQHSDAERAARKRQRAERRKER